ncbi:MAG: cell division protein FtsA [Atopococcus tabaci]|uniref:Cell division protein FtsA n=1 Tax=Atopococcus tabaci TaxID=269774 RepID=A0AA43UCF2_9LACT|nr:cell division protein FtsA [Atopococcus tabaci]
MGTYKRILTSLDIGTTSIKVIIAEIINNELNVIGVSTQESRGIKKGVIVDIDKTVTSIIIAIQEAEQKANVAVDEVIVGLPAYGLEIQSTRGVVKTENADTEITNRDIESVVSQAMIQAVGQDKEMIGLNIHQFIVDGFDDISDPRRMVGVRLEMEADVLSVPKTILHSIKKCVTMADLTISDIVIQPDALASVSLNHDHKRQGAILVDMGGGQTTVSVYKDNRLIYSFVDPEGGEYITRDISVVLNTTIDEAEQLKIKYGYAHPDEANPDNTIPVNVLSQKGVQSISEDYLAEIIQARLLQILTTIKNNLSESQLLDASNNIIVTGGNTSIPATRDLLSEVFSKSIDFFVPQQMGIRYPTFSTAVGLIQYVKEQSDVQRMVNRYVNGLEVYTRDKEESQKEVPSSRTFSSDQHPDQDRSQQGATEKITIKETQSEETTWDKFKNMINSFFD